MIRVVLADDQVLVRAGFRLLLDTEDGFEVCGEAADGTEAIRLAHEQNPDIVVMDVRMPGLDGLAATRQITADPALAGVKVLVLTTFDVDEYVFEALRSGASGFLLKDTEPVELLRALRVVASGEALLAPTVTRRLISEFIARPEQRRLDTSVLRQLTDREREVLALVAAGMSNDEIAEQLVISPATSRTHVSRILTKLGARDRAQLVVLAYESGLVSPQNRG
jgi:RNA polymerase sigma factor (sigma-70 family)